jgi:hypothetical protein
MAKITSGIGWSSASGSISGLTFAQGSQGMVLRSKGAGPTRRTRQALQISARLGSAAARWRELTPSQRREWEQAARLGRVPGYEPGMSGINLFCAVQQVRLPISSSLQLTPPTGPAPVLQYFDPPVQFGTTSTFTFRWARLATVAGSVEIRGSSPMPPQLSASMNPPMRRLVNVGANPFTGQLASWGTEWWVGLAAYSGYRIWWEARAIANDGRKSQPIRTSTILT